MDNNILVQYNGGGYDGCIWEWNFFYIDKDGKFHDVYSSGCSGVTTKLAAMLLMDGDKSSTHIYSLDKEDELKDFATETHGSLVKSIVRWFNNHNDPDAIPFAACNECGALSSYADDIRVVDAETICSDCHGSRMCECCDEYVGDTKIVQVDRDEHGGCEYICTGCKERHDGKREALERQGLLHESLCTGKPDMFSDAMRWMWV